MRYAEDALALTRQTGDRLATYVAHLVLGQAAEGSEELERASRHFGQGLRLAREAADRANAAHCIRGLARVAAVVGQSERAALLLGASEGLLEAVGTSLYAFIPQGPGQEHAESLARKQLGEEAFAATYDAGRAMTFEQAVECGLSPEDQPESQ